MAGVLLGVDRKIRVDLRLEIGALADSVVVQSASLTANVQRPRDNNFLLDGVDNNEG